jgi:DNA-binding beta-propeller fold protein YncE
MRTPTLRIFNIVLPGSHRRAVEYADRSPFQVASAAGGDSAGSLGEAMKIRPSLAIAAGLAALALAAPAAAAPTPGYAVTQQWAGPDGGWDFSSFDPARHRLYVSRTDGVTAVDVNSGQVTPHLLKANRTHAAIAINGGGEVLVTETASGSALIADAATGAVRATIPTGKKPDAAMVEPVTGLALVFDNAGGGVTLIDPKAGKAVGAIATPGGLESPATDGAGRVFVNVEDLAEIVVLDVPSRRVVAHYPLKGCESPSGLAYAPRARLLVSACGNHKALVLAADTGAVVATLAIGGRPDWAGYDARSGLVLIPTGEDGVVNLISVASAKAARVAAKAPGHIGSRSGAIDPATGRLYLPSADFTPNPGGRPTPVAGSFKILTLAPVR